MAVPALLVLALLAACAVPAARAKTDNYFQVVEGAWSDCARLNLSTQCYRSRAVACVRSSDNASASWYYCEENGLQRPIREELCLPDRCLQDCAVSTWSNWSLCDCAESPFRSRYREIVSPPRNGGAACPPLVHNTTCACGGSLATLPRNHTWGLGEWTACLPINDSEPALCGTGVRNRSLFCVDLRGTTVDVEHCLAEAAFARLLPPPSSELCRRECACVLSAWSDFTECQPTCTTPPLLQRSRSRRPLYGNCDGVDTLETQICREGVPDCPSFAWDGASPWSGCVLAPQESCGAGLQWRNVFCLETLNSSQKAVPDSLCTEGERPSRVMPCEVACRRDCVVSKWSAWTQCPLSCEEHHSNRMRVVLVPASGPGLPCPHLLERRRCPERPCASWRPQPFSTCFPPEQLLCGPGTQTRELDCVDASGSDLPSRSSCSAFPQPSLSADCYVHCPGECALSAWSAWGPCSQPCGGLAGARSRSRYFAAFAENCSFSSANLTEEEVCSVPEPCSHPVYHVSTGEWGDCLPAAAVEGLGASADHCALGLQNKTSVCLRDSAAVSAAECPISFEALEQRSCVLPCPADCMVSKWSTFSPCTGSCGAAVRTRSRYVQRPPVLGGQACPAPLDSHPVELDSVDCKLEPEDCLGAVEWRPGNWSDCRLLGLSKLSHAHSAEEQCGPGFQTRNLLCVLQDSQLLMGREYCYELPSPSTVQSCAVPCQAHCFPSHWSQFSPCTGGRLTRTRSIITPLGSNQTQSCPELADLPTQEHVNCSQPAPMRYSWTLTFDWGECILSSDNATCGVGKEYRHVSCVDTSLSPRNEALCTSPRMDTQQDCSILCDTDCELSSWSPWSPCSFSCGSGLRRRAREVQRDKTSNGRACGHLTETSLCWSDRCPLLEYQLPSFAECSLSNSSLLCGRGTTTRAPVCVRDGVTQSDNSSCAELPAPPTVSEPCSLPCPDDCVVSEWSPWQPCSDSSTHQQRSRSKLREGAEGADCPPTEEHRLCQPEPASRHAWAAGAWLDCVVANSSDASYCGPGAQHRPVWCQDTPTNTSAHESLCAASQRPEELRSCQLPCPVDCRVGPFSSWSQCPRRCQHHLSQTRERAVLVPPAHGGQGCPSLSEWRPCPPTHCDQTVILAHQEYCSSPITMTTSCGSAASVLPLSCRRDGTDLPLDECTAAVSRGEEVRGHELLSVVQSCQVGCPRQPDCLLAGWADWSQCTRLCQETAFFSLRSRRLLRAFHDVLAICSALQYEVRPCNTSAGPAPSPAPCLDFYWSSVAGSVSCQSTGGVAVEGGCPLSTRPQGLDCAVPCGPFSRCQSGRCRCINSFEEVGGVCVPEMGCSIDEHCLYPHMECTGATCVCTQGRRLLKGSCLLPPAPSTSTPLHTPPPPPPSTTLPVPTATLFQSPTATEPERSSVIATETPTVAVTPANSGGSLSLLTIILVSAVPLLVIIATAMILIIVTYRCRQSLDKQGKKSRRFPKELKISDPLPISVPDPSRAVLGVSLVGVALGVPGDTPLQVSDELHKYGMPGKTFEYSSRSMEDVDIDEALAEQGGRYTPPLTPTGPYHQPRFYPLHTDPRYSPHEPRFSPHLQHAGNHEPCYSPHLHHGNLSMDDDFKLPYMPEALPYAQHPSPPSPLHVTDDEDGSILQESRMGGGRQLYSEAESELSQSSSHYNTPLPGEPYRSPYTPTSPRSFCFSPEAPHILPPARGHQVAPPPPHHHAPPRERLRVGLDSAMVRAIDELDTDGSRSPSVASTSSSRSGARSSGSRRSGRRRRYPSNPSPAYQYAPYRDYHAHTSTGHTSTGHTSTGHTSTGHYLTPPAQSYYSHADPYLPPRAGPTTYHTSSLPRPAYHGHAHHSHVPRGHESARSHTPQGPESSRGHTPQGRESPHYVPHPFSTSSLPRSSRHSPYQQQPPPPSPQPPPPVLTTALPPSPHPEELSVPRSPPTGQRHVRFDQPSPLATHSYSFPDSPSAPPPPPPPPPIRH